MISLTTSGNSIIFNFEDNSHYLFDGTIEVPKNSLTLVTDSSNMFTFKKSATNDIFISARYDEVGMSKSELESWFKANAVDTITEDEIQAMIDESISGKADTSAVTQAISEAVSGYADSVLYNSQSKYIEFYHNGTGGTKVYELNASDFVIDGMIDDVRIETISGVSYLVIDFNTASGKEDIQIPLTDIFDPSNYYTKTEVDAIASGKADTSTVQSLNNVVTAHTANTTIHVTAQDKTNWNGKPNAVEVTQAEYDALVSGGTLDSNTFYIITDATPFDPTQYYTSAQTQSAITQAVSGKQDTLIAGSGITIDSANTISCTVQGGGKTLSGGTNISVTTGETTDTINCTLPITADTNSSVNKFIVGSGNTIQSDTNYNIIIGDENTTYGGGNTSRIYSGATILGYKNNVGNIGRTDEEKYCWSTAIGKNNKLQGGKSCIIGCDNNFGGSVYTGRNTYVFGVNNRNNINADFTDLYVFGNNNVVTKSYEVALGYWNNSSNDGTQSGNTFFSIGNGGLIQRHNAFEIRQNGDIYITKDGSDVKLQDIIPTVSNTITSGSTDAISSGAVYDAIGDINTILQSI